ncbi:MAG: molybdopterin-binding protein [Dehalococcoidales bacterium]|nr:molybdopterin-binding protein [Dehalococcoidales bacterium]
MLRKVKLDDAIGLVLGHDVTKVIPGKFKGPAFRRGHVIRKEDLPELLSIGREHIYVIELEEGEVHEEEAAIRIANAIGGSGVEFSQPKEGRVNLKAKYHGLLKINVGLLKEINSLGEILVATRHNNTVCQPSMIVAGTKIVPLYTTEPKIVEVEDICRKFGKVIDVKPIQRKKVGVIITGNEVFKGIIQDKFGEVIRKKCEALGSTIHHQVIVPDDADVIAKAAREAKEKGSEVIVICGGLSVDPDDVTVEGVRKSEADIISYGAPVMPGAMFLYALLDNVPVLGAPAAVSHNPSTILDLILPRVLSGEELKREDIIEIGHGGLCLNCEKCSFPVCPFGK